MLASLAGLNYGLSGRSVPASGPPAAPAPVLPSRRLDICLYRHTIRGMARAATTADAFNAVAEPRGGEILDVSPAASVP